MLQGNEAVTYFVRKGPFLLLLFLQHLCVPRTVRAPHPPAHRLRVVTGSQPRQALGSYTCETGAPRGRRGTLTSVTQLVGEGLGLRAKRD